MTILIGTDPEAFVVREDGTVDMAIGKIGGTKHEPLPVRDGAVQEDNVLAEFNTTPAATADAFVTIIDTVVTQLTDRLKQHGLSLLFKPSHRFDKDDLWFAGPQAMEFGCEPDNDCWSGRINHKKIVDDGLRTAGGHVHIGYDNPTEDMSYDVACMCEYLLGVPSVILDTDTERRSMYGASGACRIKPYGVEYRVLSNFWLTSDNLKRWVFAQSTQAVEQVSMLKQWQQTFSREEIAACINGGDVDLARRIVHELNITMPEA